MIAENQETALSEDEEIKYNGTVSFMTILQPKLARIFQEQPEPGVKMRDQYLFHDKKGSSRVRVTIDALEDGVGF